MSSPRSIPLCAAKRRTRTAHTMTENRAGSVPLNASRRVFPVLTKGPPDAWLARLYSDQPDEWPRFRHQPGAEQRDRHRAGATVGEIIPVGGNPSTVAINQAANRIYVGNLADKSISFIGGESLAMQATLQVPYEPVTLTVDEPTSRIYTTTTDTSRQSGIVSSLTRP